MSIKRQTYINGDDLKAALREKTKDEWSEDTFNSEWSKHLLNSCYEAGQFYRIYDSFPELLESTEKYFFSCIIEVLKDGHQNEKSFDIKFWR